MGVRSPSHLDSLIDYIKGDEKHIRNQFRDRNDAGFYNVQLLFHKVTSVRSVWLVEMVKEIEGI